MTAFNTAALPSGTSLQPWRFAIVGPGRVQIYDKDDRVIGRLVSQSAYADALLLESALLYYRGGEQLVTLDDSSNAPAS